MLSPGTGCSEVDVVTLVPPGRFSLLTVSERSASVCVERGQDLSREVHFCAVELLKSTEYNR